MKEQVMIYEVKSSANNNSKELFSKDNKSFFWNDSMFKNLTNGDFVIVVNQYDKWILFAEFDGRRIQTKTDPKRLTVSFTYEAEDYSVKAPTFQKMNEWKHFIRLIIKARFEANSSWIWKSLGNSEISYLHGENVSSEESTKRNRMQNIEQLEKLSDDQNFRNVLEECKKNFIDQNQVNFGKSEVKEKLPEKPPLAHRQITSILPDNYKKYSAVLTSIKTKPFILLAGLSGTGKSRLVRTLSFKTCVKKELQNDPLKPGNFEIIPVRPNWHDSSELMGYVSRIADKKYISTTFLKFIAKAWKHREIPFFLCLDEMNLAPVEHYFAEYLSIIETRQSKNKSIITDYILAKSSFDDPSLYTTLLNDLSLSGSDFFEGIRLPDNLIVMGTVNMDETTHSFSRKVLDRAMTIEMNEIDLENGLDKSNQDWSYPDDYIPANRVLGEFTSGSQVVNLFPEHIEVLNFLKRINMALDGTPFKIAYRTRDEFLIYCYYSSMENADTDWLKHALDRMVSMKILSRIEGDENKTSNAITELQTILTEDYNESYKKLREMRSRLELSGYTSYWV